MRIESGKSGLICFEEVDRHGLTTQSSHNPYRKEKVLSPDVQKMPEVKGQDWLPVGARGPAFSPVSGFPHLACVLKNQIILAQELWNGA